MISTKMFKIFKAKINDLIFIILRVMLMSREQTCGECGRTFSSHDSGQKLCNDCHRMDEYIMGWYDYLVATQNIYNLIAGEKKMKKSRK